MSEGIFAKLINKEIIKESIESKKSIAAIE